LPALAPGNGNYRPGGNVEGVPLPVENIAARGQPPDLRYVDMGDHDMAHHRLFFCILCRTLRPLTNITTMMSIIMPEFLRMSQPKHKALLQQSPPSTCLAIQLSKLRLARLEPSPMDGPTRVPSPTRQPQKSSGGLRAATCTSLILKLTWLVWNQTSPVESGWSSNYDWLTSEAAIYWDVHFAITNR